jgi:hypothetical protein
LDYYGKETRIKCKPMHQELRHEEEGPRGTITLHYEEIPTLIEMKRQSWPPPFKGEEKTTLRLLLQST